VHSRRVVLYKHTKHINVESLARVRDLWLANVERGLFNPDASDICKYVGFSLLELLVVRLPARAWYVLLTQNAMAALMENLGVRPQRPLYAKAHRTLAVLLHAATRASAQWTLLGHLLGEYGHYNFDKTTQTNTVAALVNSLDSQHLTLYQLRLAQIFSNPDKLFDIVVSILLIVV